MTKQDSELLKAVDAGDTDRIRAAVEAGANVNAVDEEGNSAVYHAVHGLVENEEASALLVLKELGADVNVKNPKRHNETPLHYFMRRYGRENSVPTACIEPFDETALTILKKVGADFNAQDDRGNTPVMLATATELTADDLKMLAGSVDWNHANHMGSTLAHIFCQDCVSIERLQALVALGGNLNVVDKAGETPFHCYVAGAMFQDENDIAATVKLFHEAGVDLHARTPQGDTAADLYRWRYVDTRNTETTVLEKEIAKYQPQSEQENPRLQVSVDDAELASAKKPGTQLF